MRIFIEDPVQEFIDSLHSSQPENFVPPHPWTVVGSRTEEVDNYLVTFSVIENVCISNIAQDVN